MDIHWGKMLYELRQRIYDNDTDSWRAIDTGVLNLHPEDYIRAMEWARNNEQLIDMHDPRLIGIRLGANCLMLEGVAFFVVNNYLVASINVDDGMSMQCNPALLHAG